MTRRCLASLGALAIVIAVVSLAPEPVAGPTSLGSFVEAAEAFGEGGQGPTAVPDTWAPSRTPWGHPDLQGVWANDSVTPLERPKELAGRPLLTDQEVAALKAKAEQLFGENAGDAAFADSVFIAALSEAREFRSNDGQTGNYNQFWLVEREFDNRTSLIVDPPDGRLPPLTPEAQKRQDERAEARRRSPADGPEDRRLSERCITFGMPNLLAGYNSNYQILQTPGHVVILQELIHDARIIPLDGRPHLGDTIRQWHGDSRGRWEGNTLVVDTTNFSPKSDFRGSTAIVHLIERFTRVGPNTIHYEFTVEDPTTWTRSWTAMIPLKPTPGKIFEYACHEGNIGLVGILAGHRAEEKAAQGEKTGSR